MNSNSRTLWNENFALLSKVVALLWSSNVSSSKDDKDMLVTALQWPKNVSSSKDDKDMLVTALQWPKNLFRENMIRTCMSLHQNVVSSTDLLIVSLVVSKEILLYLYFNSLHAPFPCYPFLSILIFQICFFALYMHMQIIISMLLQFPIPSAELFSMGVFPPWPAWIGVEIFMCCNPRCKSVLSWTKRDLIAENGGNGTKD